MKPLIGITGREFKYELVQGAPAILDDVDVAAVLTDYVDAVLASGGLPVGLPQRVDPAMYVDRLDGLILAGGADIDPKQYDREPDPDLGPTDPGRDEFELSMAGLAIDAGLPTLGICRGLQILAVSSGGTLEQHRPDHAHLDRPVKELTHAVSIADGSILAGVYGTEHRVNSLHHQVVDSVGDAVDVTARSPEGDIEGIEVRGKPIVGVQWHPEMLQVREPIFDWLVRAAS